MSIELKPCPFCGGEAELVIDEPFKGFTFVECHECGSRGSISKERQAIKAWNTRAERTARNNDAWEGFFECSSCGASFKLPTSEHSKRFYLIPFYCPVCGAKVVE